MSPEKAAKTLVQCDFDGTITEDDVSFMMLDAFASGDWRQLHREYEKARMSVGRFNSDVFAMVNASRESLLGAVRDRVRIRTGFGDLVSYCRRQGFHFVIVSNGLDFYIKDILKSIGLTDIEVFAARTDFHPSGLTVRYIGPDGNQLDEDFKLAYVNSFLDQGYRIIYLGNGTSDIPAAARCHYIFATASLLRHCQQTKLNYSPFTSFNEVVRVLESW